MNRRAFIAVLGGSIFTGPIGVEAQQADKVRQVGVLWSGSVAFTTIGDGRKAFVERLKDFGWVEGQNLRLERRYAEGKLDRLPDLAAELVQLKVSMIVAFGTQAALAAKRATTTIPIVILASDPVGTGLVTSLAHPGGNITGLTVDAGLEEIFSKRLELLKEAAQKISRVGILANRSNPSEARVLDAIAPTARALRLTFVPAEVRSPTGFDDAFALLSREHVDALTAIETPLTVEHRSSIMSYATRNRLPTVFGDRVFVDAGGLMSYGVNYTDLLRRLPNYIDKILRGARPSELP